MYQVTGNLAYARTAWALAQQYIEEASTSPNDVRENFIENAIMFDWLYPALSADEREAAVQTAGVTMRWASIRRRMSVASVWATVMRTRLFLRSRCDGSCHRRPERQSRLVVVGHPRPMAEPYRSAAWTRLRQASPRCETRSRTTRQSMQPAVNGSRVQTTTWAPRYCSRWAPKPCALRPVRTTSSGSNAVSPGRGHGDAVLRNSRSRPDRAMGRR